MLTNTAGTPRMIFRSGIGKGSLVRAVMAVISVVQCVPRFICTILIRIIVLRTKLMLANTAGSMPIFIRTPVINGKRSLLRAMIIVVQCVPDLMLFLMIEEGMEEGIKHIVVLIPECKQSSLDSNDDVDDDDDDDVDNNEK